MSCRLVIAPSTGGSGDDVLNGSITLGSAAANVSCCSGSPLLLSTSCAFENILKKV